MGENNLWNRLTKGFTAVGFGVEDQIMRRNFKIYFLYGMKNNRKVLAYRFLVEKGKGDEEDKRIDTELQRMMKLEDYNNHEINFNGLYGAVEKIAKQEGIEIIYAKIETDLDSRLLKEKGYRFPKVAGFEINKGSKKLK